jgi:hypothetical protein
MTKTPAGKSRKNSQEELQKEYIALAKEHLDRLIGFFEDSRISNQRDIIWGARERKAPKAFNNAALILDILIEWAIEHEYEKSSDNNLGIGTKEEHRFLVLRETIANILKKIKITNHNDILNEISEGLLALNRGETPALFAPYRVKGEHTKHAKFKKDAGFKKDQELAILWVYFYRGRNGNKKSAVGKVARELGIADRTIMKWEKQATPRLKKRRWQWTNTTYLEDAENAGAISSLKKRHAAKKGNLSSKDNKKKAMLLNAGYGQHEYSAAYRTYKILHNKRNLPEAIKERINVKPKE